MIAARDLDGRASAISPVLSIAVS